MDFMLIASTRLSSATIAVTMVIRPHIANVNHDVENVEKNTIHGTVLVKIQNYIVYNAMEIMRRGTLSAQQGLQKRTGFRNKWGSHHFTLNNSE